MSALKEQGDSINIGDDNYSFDSIINLSKEIFVFSEVSARAWEEIKINEDKIIRSINLTYALKYPTKDKCYFQCINHICRLYIDAKRKGAIGVYWRKEPEIKEGEDGYYYFYFRLSFWNKDGQVECQ